MIELIGSFTIVSPTDSSISIEKEGAEVKFDYRYFIRCNPLVLNGKITLELGHTLKNLKTGKLETQGGISLQNIDASKPDNKGSRFFVFNKFENGITYELTITGIASCRLPDGSNCCDIKEFKIVKNYTVFIDTRKPELKLVTDIPKVIVGRGSAIPFSFNVLASDLNGISAVEWRINAEPKYQKAMPLANSEWRIDLNLPEEREHTVFVKATDNSKNKNFTEISFSLSTSYLTGDHWNDSPMLLLPIRIETKIKNDELWVRFFPDRMFFNAHERQISAQEKAAFDAYWSVVGRSNCSESDKRSAWRTIANQFGSKRAAWIISNGSSYDPKALPKRKFAIPTLEGLPPQFFVYAKFEGDEEPIKFDGRQIRKRLTILPIKDPVEYSPKLTNVPYAIKLLDKKRQSLSNTRFQLIYSENNKVLRKSIVANPAGEYTTQGLTLNQPYEVELTINNEKKLVRIDPQKGQPTIIADPDLLDARWMTNFEQAVIDGMAVKINLSGLKIGGKYPTRLVVTGICDGDSSGTVKDLFDNQRYTAGLGFVPFGTPTNNTEQGTSGYSKWDDIETNYNIEVKDPSLYQGHNLPDPLTNASRLSAALGWGENEILKETLKHVENAGMVEDALSENMRRALWPLIESQFLSLLNGTNLDVHKDKIKEHFCQYVEGAGPLPAIRVGSLPYGVLPVTDFDSWGKVIPEKFEILYNEDSLCPSNTIWGKLLDNSGKPLSKISIEAYDINGLIGKSITNPDGAFTIPKIPVNTSEIILKVILPNRYGTTFKVKNTRELIMIKAVEPEDYFEKSMYDQLMGLLDSWKEIATDECAVPRISKRCKEDDAQVNVTKILQIQPVSTGYNLRPFVNENFVNELLENLRYCGFANQTEPYDPPRELVRQWKEAWDAAKSISANTWKQFEKTKLHELYGWWDEEDIQRLEGEGQIIGISGTEEVTAIEVLKVLVNKSDKSDKIEKSKKTLLYQLLYPIIGFSSVKSAIETLSNYPSANIDRIFRQTLDLFSHRLDAWISSFAYKRLMEMRAVQPTGLRLGAYGYVEGLDKVLSQTNQKANLLSFGYIQAPSRTQAATAAVMHNAFLTNSLNKGEVSGQEEPYRINLSSERVRRGMQIAEGIRMGQSLGAILGYQFERALHERSLDQYIDEFRAAFSIKSYSLDEGEDVSSETITSKNVVDGLSLVNWWDALAEQNKTIDEIKKVPELKDLTDGKLIIELNSLSAGLDGYQDLLLFESTHQAVLGNYDRSVAAGDAISGMGYPPEIQSMSTPITGKTFTQRVLWLFPDKNCASKSARSLAEPRIACFVEKALPIKETTTLSASYNGVSQIIQIAALGLEPIDLFYLAPLVSGNRSTEIDQRATLFVRKAYGISEEAPVSLSYSLELENTLYLASQLYRLLASGRAASGDDFIMGVADFELSATVEDLQKRLSNKLIRGNEFGLLPECNKMLTISEPIAFLKEISRLGINVPYAIESVAFAKEELTKRIALANVLKTQAGISKDFKEKIGLLIQSIKTILGDNFIVLPEFVVVEPTVFDPKKPLLKAPVNLRDQSEKEEAQLLNNLGEARIREWIREAATTHEPLSKLDEALMLLEVSGNAAPLSLHVAQLPFVKDSTRWMALNDKEAGRKVKDLPRENTLSMVIVNGAEAYPNWQGKVSGLVLDQWNEFIPDPVVNTGLAYHFQSPNTQAPQSMLLAVPSSNKRWEPIDIANTIVQTMDLAKVRSVDLEAMGDAKNYQNTLLFPCIFNDMKTEQNGSIKEILLNRLYFDLFNNTTPLFTTNLNKKTIEENKKFNDGDSLNKNIWLKDKEGHLIKYNHISDFNKCDLKIFNGSLIKITNNVISSRQEKYFIFEIENGISIEFVNQTANIIYLYFEFKNSKAFARENIEIFNYLYNVEENFEFEYEIVPNSYIEIGSAYHIVSCLLIKCKGIKLIRLKDVNLISDTIYSPESKSKGYLVFKDLEGINNTEIKNAELLDAFIESKSITIPFQKSIREFRRHEIKYKGSFIKSQTALQFTFTEGNFTLNIVFQDNEKISVVHLYYLSNDHDYLAFSANTEIVVNKKISTNLGIYRMEIRSKNPSEYILNFELTDTYPAIHKTWSNFFLYEIQAN